MLTNVEDLDVWLGELTEWVTVSTGVHPKTVARWRRRRAWPRWLVRLVAVELDGQLGLIHRDWRGWRLDRRTGRLVVPADLMVTEPYSAAELLARIVRAEMDSGGRFAPAPRRRWAGGA